MSDVEKLAPEVVANSASEGIRCLEIWLRSVKFDSQADDCDKYAKATWLLAKLLHESKCPQPHCDNKGQRLVPYHNWFEMETCDWCRQRAIALGLRS